MGEPQFLKTETVEQVLTVTLDRPKANAFDNQMVDEWLAVLKQAGRDDSVRCLVLTGAGRFFSAGQDVTALGSQEGELSFRRHLRQTYNRVIGAMHALQLPIVGAINGPAVGAGLGVALATDLRIAADSASFIFGFSGIGLTADSGTSLALPQLIGTARSFEMAFTNEPLDAQRALEWGLVNRVVPDDQLLSAAGELAAKLAQGPTRAFGLTKRAFYRAAWSQMQSVLEYEAELQEIAGRTADHKEGLAAFLEKRPPKYGGR